MGATAVRVAKPMILSAPMIRAFLDSIRYIVIELNQLTGHDARDGAPARNHGSGRRFSGDAA